MNRPILPVMIGIICFAWFSGKAQQNNNWFFGQGVAISFNPGNLPIPHFISSSIMNTNESCASISDENGNLLFYTNGQQIFNRNHQVMVNGSGLMGHESSFQGAVILRQPKHDSIYYVFTADAYETNFANGYRYSIVNMNRQGGNGEVVSKKLPVASQLHRKTHGSQTCQQH